MSIQIKNLSPAHSRSHTTFALSVCRGSLSAALRSWPLCKQPVIKSKVTHFTEVCLTYALLRPRESVGSLHDQQNAITSECKTQSWARAVHARVTSYSNNMGCHVLSSTESIFNHLNRYAVCGVYTHLSPTLQDELLSHYLKLICLRRSKH